jgi:hypothetical protein
MEKEIIKRKDRFSLSFLHKNISVENAVKN